MKKTQEKKRIKLWYLLFTIFFFLLFIFLYLWNIYDITQENRKLPSKQYGKKEYALRGNIITADNYIVAKSIHVYKAIIDTRFLAPEKKDLFINLFSIYTNIAPEIIQDKIDAQKKKGKLVLSYNIDSRVAANLQQLKSKLLKMKVFIPLSKKSSFIIGLDITISGDKRVYQYKDTLTPVIGFVKKFEKKRITRINGVKGVEKFYNEKLNDYQNGLQTGSRDIGNDIIFNGNSKNIPRINGKNVHLTIPLRLQKNIEFILDKYKKKFEAKEIVASIMKSDTGEVLAFASSNRYDPKNIKKNEVPYLNIKAVESSYEYGSVIKPIIMALAFDKNRVSQDELFNAFNKGRRNKKGYYPKGKYKIDKFRVGDDHNFKKRYITPDDIIVYSSNIGILQIAQRLNAQEFIDGFKKFNISTKTNIDLPYENKGLIHTLKQYQAYEGVKDNIYKATDSYGQGMLSTFIQVLSAYSTFNNDGNIVKPYIVSKVTTPSNEIISSPTLNSTKVIKKSTANIIKNMLIKTVEKGTGKNTYIEGLEIGGKTGTSQIAKGGKYQRKYISSFFGFVNDGRNKYTIGVTVFEPSYKYHYASQSAAVVFRDSIHIMKNLNFIQ
jgi:cell division protein FtsI (penicillin-binding protein 3)